MACNRSSVQVRYPPLRKFKAADRLRSATFFMGLSEKMAKPGKFNQLVPFPAGIRKWPLFNHLRSFTVHYP